MRSRFITDTDMLTCIRILVACSFLLGFCGCTAKIYHRSFWDEKMPELNENVEGYYVFDDFAVSPICDVSSSSRVPILDSAFKVFFLVLPTDTTPAGNDFFLKNFVIDTLTILDRDTRDTLALLTEYELKLHNWRTYNQKEFNFGRIVISRNVQRIKMRVVASNEGPDGRIRHTSIEFRMFRYDGYETVDIEFGD